jgi:hypothetical protein
VVKSETRHSAVFHDEERVASPSDIDRGAVAAATATRRRSRFPDACVSLCSLGCAAVQATGLFCWVDI